MPADLREAHERNDETLERIYIGRRFKNDTERLEKLFELYTQMVGRQALVTGAAQGIGRATAEALAAAGAHLIVSDRQADKLQGVVAALQGPGGSLGGILSSIEEKQKETEGAAA